MCIRMCMISVSQMTTLIKANASQEYMYILSNRSEIYRTIRIIRSYSQGRDNYSGTPTRTRFLEAPDRTSMYIYRFSDRRTRRANRPECRKPISLPARSNFLGISSPRLCSARSHFSRLFRCPRCIYSLCARVASICSHGLSTNFTRYPRKWRNSYVSLADPGMDVRVTERS